MPISIKQIIALLLFSTSVFAQVEEINPPDFIKTITFKGDTPESQLPIIKLGQPLMLEFDALNGDEEDFYYEIKHYNFDWTPSILVESEYLSGFNKQRIIDYENSFNTYQIYSHYRVTIPNRNTKGIKISGNYIITIYDDYDEVVFSRKFMVYEQIANVGVAIKRSRDVSEIGQKQSVDISINSSTLQFNNPQQTVKTLIVQNNNLNTAIINLKPQYTLANELIYRYTKESSFFAGNEFLYFENKDLRTANNGVQFTRLKDLYNSYLFRNVPRNNLEYTYNPDINGNFLVNILNSNAPETEADYAVVHFALQMDELTEGQKVHVYGNFNNYAINESTLMTYYNDENSYELPLVLKQGFYNYKYIVVNKDGTVDENTISGNFYQTENNYKVLVYYRDLGARYDRIIGLGEANSVGITN